MRWNDTAFRTTDALIKTTSFPGKSFQKLLRTMLKFTSQQRGFVKMNLPARSPGRKHFTHHEMKNTIKKNRTTATIKYNIC